MPITQTIDRKYTLISLTFDMLSGVGQAKMRREMAGEDPRDEVFAVDGAQFQQLLATPGVAGQSLAEQVTNAVYTYLVNAHLIDGVIS